MFSDQYAHTVCAGITAPGTEKDQPHKKMSVFQISCKEDKRQHICNIYQSEKCRHHLFCLIFRIGKYIDKHQKHKGKDYCHHSIFFKSQKNCAIIKNCPQITGQLQKIHSAFMHAHGIVQLSHADQRNTQQCQKQNISSAHDRQKGNDHQNNAA